MTFVHDTLFEICHEEKTDLVRAIRDAVMLESKYEEMGRRVSTKCTSRASPRESHNDPDNLRVEIKNDYQRLANISATDRSKMQQKIDSYTPLTPLEVQVLTKIPIRPATSEEKEEMTKAVSKIHTKLHFLYTLGIRNIPGSSPYNRTSMLSNFNMIYKSRNAIEGWSSENK